MFLEEKKYLEYVGKYPQKYPGPNKPFEDHFEFNSLFYSVYRRFIELLYPGTNHFFRKTSKKNYEQCLDLRGIEVGQLNFGGYTGYHGELSFESGKMNLNLDKIPKNWTKCLVVTGVVYIEYPLHGAAQEIEKLDFVKKYKRLYFNHGYAEQLECLIHPTLEKVDINAYSLEFDHLLRCLKKLNVCQRLEIIDINNYCNVDSAAAFKKLKQQVEVLATRQPNAEFICNLGINKQFQIHENVLCHTPVPDVFVKDYNFDNLPQ